MARGLRRCVRCGKYKPNTMFGYVYRHGNRYADGTCAECRAEIEQNKLDKGLRRKHMEMMREEKANQISTKQLARNRNEDTQRQLQQLLCGGF